MFTTPRAGPVSAAPRQPQIARISEWGLRNMWLANPHTYEEDLDNLLGKRIDEKGFRMIDESAVIIPTAKFSMRDLGEAFIGIHEFHRIMENPYGMRGGRAHTSPPSGWRFEDVGSGALGPDSFGALQAWLATLDRLLDARLLYKYTYAVQVVRTIMEWELDVRLQEPKIPRYSIPQTPPGGGDGGTGEDEGLKPGEEFPSASMTGVFVRAARMEKQGLSLLITWESQRFDQTGDLMNQADRISERIGIRVEERCEKALWGMRNTYKYNDVLTATYRSTGSYVNFIDNNPLENGEQAIDAANQQLKKQTDPETGLEIEPEGNPMLVVSPYLWRRGWRLQNPYQILTNAQTPDTEQVRAAGAFNFDLYETRRGVRLMQVPVNSGGLGLTEAKARDRWIWGNVRQAFRVRSAKDLTTYRYSIADSPGLSKRDIILEIDVSEMSSPTCIEPRHVILSTGSAGG